MHAPTSTELLLRHEHRIIIAGVVMICALSWLYVLYGAGMQPQTAQWDLSYWAIMLAMWWIMMTPSATPIILLYARVYPNAQSKNRFSPGVVPTALFLSGYLLAWLAFSLAATGLQWGLEQAGLVHAMMMWSINYWLSAGFLILAGFTNSHRSSLPASAIAAHRWTICRGAVAMGVYHG